MNVMAEVSALLATDQNAQLFQAVVVGTSGNTVQIRRSGQVGPDAQYYPKAKGLTVVGGDEVIVARVGSGYIVLVVIAR